MITTTCSVRENYAVTSDNKQNILQELYNVILIMSINN